MHVCTKPMRKDTAGRSVTFTTHRATIWDPPLAELCHATPSASLLVHSIPARGRCNFPASRTKMSDDHLWRRQAEPKHPLPQCFWCHAIICWGFKILIPDGAFLALEERLQKCLFICLTRQLLIKIWRQHLLQHLLVHNEQNKKFMAESLTKKTNRIFSCHSSYLCGWLEYFTCQTDVCYKKAYKENAEHRYTQTSHKPWTVGVNPGPANWAHVLHLSSWLQELGLN